MWRRQSCAGSASLNDKITSPKSPIGFSDLLLHKVIDNLKGTSSHVQSVFISYLSVEMDQRTVSNFYKTRINQWKSEIGFSYYMYSNFRKRESLNSFYIIISICFFCILRCLRRHCNLAQRFSTTSFIFHKSARLAARLDVLNNLEPIRDEWLTVRDRVTNILTNFHKIVKIWTCEHLITAYAPSLLLFCFNKVTILLSFTNR